MKTNRLKFVLLILFLQFFSFSSLSAAVLVEEGFDSNIDGWSVSSRYVYHYSDNGNGWLFIARNNSAEKTFSLGSTYANQTVTISMNWWAPDDWESSPDYLHVRTNDSEDHNDNNGGGYATHTFSATADGNGDITIYISPRTTQNSEIAYIDSITIETFDPIRSCPGQVLPNLDGTTVSATDNDNGVIRGYTTHYYQFTPSVDGHLRVNASMGKSSNSLFIYNDCAGATLASNTGDSKNKSISADVLSNNRIVIVYERRYSTNTNFDIEFIFTASVAEANDDTFSVSPNTTLNGNILGNDNGPGISLSSNNEPDHGTLTIASDGSFTYIPDTDYEGTDSFTYEIEDSNGKTSSATVTITVAPQTDYGGFHDFERVNPDSTLYVRGNYAIAGNTVTCLTNLTSGYASNSDTCRGDTGDTDFIKRTSNMRVNKYLDIDSNTATWNSTSSYINLPATYDDQDRGILWAGLFWQGRISNGNKYSKHYAVANGGSFNFVETKGVSNSSIVIENTDANKILLKVNNGNYDTVQASTVYKEQSGGDVTYAAYADVTSKLQAANLGDGKQVFTVANLTTEIGRESSPGLFGGWSLVVIYAEDVNGEVRNITVLSGFDEVGNPSDSFPITGLKLPKTNTVNASLSLFSGEGETLYRTDSVKISPDDANYDYMPGAPDDDNIFDGVFSGVLRDHLTDGSGSSIFNDLALNNNGLDVDTYDVSTLVTKYRNDNEDLDTLYMQWRSNNDYITPSMIAFGVQLYEPKLCYDYSIKQDGHYLKIDRTTSTLASIIGTLSSSPLEVEVYLRNEESDLVAEGVSLSSNFDPQMFDHIGHMYTSNVNGSYLYDRGLPGNAPCTYDIALDNSLDNEGCSDGHNIRKGNGTLDAGDYIYTKFLIKPTTSGLSDINESLGLTIDYYVPISNFNIPYFDYTLGGPNVPICPPADAYVPEFGYFNVISTGNDQYNNLFTQVSRKPFDVDVIFDDDPLTSNNDAPSSDLNTTVLVEVIDIDSFGDLNASCKKPDSRVSAWPVFVDLKITNSNYQTTVPPQDPDFFNFAVQNATYRVWYFSDENNTLIENWTASTDNNGATLLSIDGLYDKDTFPKCENDCDSDPTTTSCFDCIKRNYARALCARDNFSVRPESYDLRIYDVDQNLAQDDPDKDTTKVDLSTPKKQTPIFKLKDGAPIELAAKYQYRYDINVTGHDTLDAIPGYTRIFNASSEYTSILQWVGPNSSVCNDPTNRTLDFYIANGQLRNDSFDTSFDESSHDNVGDYNISIIDRTWTAVDWNASMITHHDSSFYSKIIDPASGVEVDCVMSSTQTTTTYNGCLISSNHEDGGNDMTYRNVPVTFHPYAFSIDNNLSVGPNYLPIANKSFVYMNNISVNENMATHFYSDFVAHGYEDTLPLSNYTAQCYAKDTNLTIFKTQTRSPDIAFDTIVHDLNTSGAEITGYQLSHTNVAGDVNGSSTVIIPAAFWQKDQNGSLSLLTNANYSRAVDLAVNPEDINFTSISLADTNITNQFSADLNPANVNTQGSISLSDNVKFYYGRSMAPKVSIICTGSPCQTGTHPSNVFDTPNYIYFAIFCDPSGSGVCNTADLPIGSDNITVGDTRWWTSTYHDANVTTARIDGTIGTLSEKSSSGQINPLSKGNKNGFTTEAIIQYSGPFPYEAELWMGSSPWLIYDEANAAATRNFYKIEFLEKGGWSGLHEEDSTTKTSNTPGTNGRIMW